MDRALVVIEPTEETKELVREAGELAGGVDAELLLVHVTTQEEFEEQGEFLTTLSEYSGSFGTDSVREGAQQFARDVGREMLDGVDVDWRAIGALGDEHDAILDVAADEGVDHVFVGGRKRSPAGKAIFGDLAQSIVLNFDGAVTIVAR